MRSTSNNLNSDEMQDDKVLAMLATEASTLKLDEVGKTILMVKPGDSIKEVNKNLTSASSQALAKTYAHLTNLKEDEEDVTKFLKEGLVEMIFFRLKQLMPAGCKKCNQVHVIGREEVPKVTCRMCGIGACKDCYPVEEAMGKWSYLCGSCDKEVSKMMGEDALKPSLFSAVYRKKKSGKDKTTIEDGDTEEEKEEEKDDNVEEKKDEEVIEVEEDFQEVKNHKRGFKGKKKDNASEQTKNEKDDEIKPICHHFKKARCHHGMSGKVSYNGTPKCPFRHPMICQRLLRNGDRGRGGCRGKEAGCNEFHQVKMCYSSMNSKKCSNGKECSNGYHVKGTVVTKEMISAKPVRKEREDFPPLPTNANVPKFTQSKGQEKQPETETSNNSNLSSFLGQLLLQQQEIMQQQQQARQEQLQMQQQMLQLMSRMAGPTESRAPTPMMGVMPSNLMGTQAFRGVGA